MLQLLKNGARSSDYSVEYLLRARRAEDAVRSPQMLCTFTCFKPVWRALVMTSCRLMK